MTTVYAERRMQNVVVQVGNPASPQVLTLIQQLDDYLTHLYPPETNDLLSVAALQQPNVTFLTATVGADVAGCGAIVNHHDAYAELKRMFVLPNFRGLKIGRCLLSELEACALAVGLRVMRLEAGIYQPEALGLYEKAGYQRRQPFGHYTENAFSVFMEKTLA